MGKLDGKTALITGVDSAVGLATAKKFVDAGAYIFVTGRRTPELTAAVNEIGNNVTGVQIDVSNPADLDRLFARIEREEGRLDIVFPHADVAEFAPVGKITEEEDYQPVFNDKVKGLFFTVQKALPLLTDGASIILTASVVSEEEPANSIFSATTAAIRSLARTWTTDFKNRRIRVNVVSSGSLEKPGLNDLVDAAKAGEQRLRMFSNGIPFRMPSTLDEIAKAVVSLCDESSDVTGAELFMDGGIAHLKKLPESVPLGRLGTPDEIAKNIVFLASDDSSHLTGIELFVGGGMAAL